MTSQLTPALEDKPQKPLHLTEEEALALLEICMLTDLEDSPVCAQAMTKLGLLCREFMRPDLPAEAVVTDSRDASMSSRVQRTLERLRHRNSLRREVKTASCA